MEPSQIKVGELYGVHRKDGLDRDYYEHFSIPVKVLAIDPDLDDFGPVLREKGNLIRWYVNSKTTVLTEIKGPGISSPGASIGTPLIVGSGHIRLPVDEMVVPAIRNNS